MSLSASVQNARPQKRPRTALDPPPQDSGSAPGSLRLKRHSEELWFDDGNIILAAGDSGFRVFRSLLASQSTVFADMFSSSSSDAGEVFEGCPVVHVSDTPGDVAHFLRALLPTSQRVLFSRKFHFSFHQISAIIRLAHKYNVQDILDQAIESLQNFFTHDFDVWERGAGKESVKVRPHQAIGAINLARLVDRPCLLPTAFYKCALLGGSVLDGYKREDKSVEYLQQQDIKRCVNGRNKLVEEALDVILDIFIARPCEECETPAPCEAALQWLLREAIKSSSRSTASVLQGWDDLIRECAQESHLCAICQAVVIEREYNARRRVWDALPDIFDIEVDGWSATASDEDGGDAA